MLRKGMFLADRYEILEQIGTGGMSDVYKAKCHKLNRYVAIKVLKSEFSQDKTFVSKFRVEAQSAAGLTHPNIVNVYDVGDEDGIHYIVMELVEGITLKKYIEKRGKLPYKEAISIAIQVANGMEAAHSHNIVHRDIKPQNIIISKEGKVKVTDFGIAKAASSATINSSAMGSVHYISPEQARGGYSDQRSDIYSFGITLYEMLTGVVPFDGDTTVAVAVQHIQDEIPAPSTLVADIPIAIDKIVMKCTQKKTERRYQNASELIADLKKALVMPDQDFVKIAPMYGTAPINNTQNIQQEVIKQVKPVESIEKTAKVEKVEPKKADTKKKFYDDDKLDDNYDDGEDEDIEDYYDDDEELYDRKAKTQSKDIDNESNDKLDKMMKWIGMGIAAVILIITIFVVVKLVGAGVSSSSNSNKETTTAEETTTKDKNSVKVPDVKGMTESQAKTALNKVNLGYKAVYESSSTVAAGKIISQDIEPDTSVDKNTTITVTVSSGEETKANITVPDVLKMAEAEATSVLQNYGFSVNTDYDYSDTVEAGLVISQSPSANTSSQEGVTVTIVISRGQEVRNVTVPKVIGLDESTARQTLESNELTVNVNYVTSASNVAYGNVISQNYSAGATVQAGSSITITVSHYEQPTTTQAPTTAMPIQQTTTATQTTQATQATTQATQATTQTTTQATQAQTTTTTVAN